MAITSGSVNNMTYTNGNILSGAMLNQHTHLISDHVPRFTILADDNNINSGAGINSWTNVYGVPMKVIETNNSNTLPEIIVGTPIVSGDYIPVGSTISINSTTSASTNRCRISFLMSGGTINGV